MNIRGAISRDLRNASALLAVIVALVLPPRRRTLVWGPIPIISNKYWSLAMRALGRDSVTLMENVYAINDHSDFDLYLAELVPPWIPTAWLRRVLAIPAALLWTVRNAQVVHMPFSGGPLGRTTWWRLEAPLYRLKGIKMVVMPYGADAYAYSRVIDTSLRAGLQMSYPDAARQEGEILDRIAYWTRRADVIVTGTMIDAIGRSDVFNVQPCCIDTNLWVARDEYSRHDGRTGPVTVIHTPNHRGFKGTEFLVAAVDQLRSEGLQVDLDLLERRPNSAVREAMRHADILAEQFIASIYALSGIEGMASGLPLLVNLESEPHTRVFRRYAYLDECPALSTTPETLTANLRRLVTDPALRETLGRAGRRYVEKYHSYTTAQYMFGSIYRRIVDGEDIDLARLFHPLFSDFVKATPRIQHPLTENHLPPT